MTPRSRRRDWAIVVVFALVSAVLGLGALRLKLDASISAMLPDKSSVADLQREASDVFGSDGIMVALVEGDIYTPAGVATLRRVSADLAKVPGVTSVTSAGNAQRMVDDDGFLLTEDLLPDNPTAEEIASAREYLETSPLYRGGLLVAEDGQAANIIMEVDGDADSEALSSGIRGMLQTDWQGAGMGAFHLVGGPLIDGEMRATLAKEMPLLGGLAALLILVMLYLNFRTVRGALLPLMTVSVGLLWSLGVMGWIGAELSTLSIIAPVVILAVGSSFSLHLLGRFFQELAHGADKRAAVGISVKETGLGVLISGLAISAALSTFALSGMPTVRSLGLLTAGGVLTTLLASLVLLPAVLGLMRAPRKTIDPEQPGVIARFLEALARFVDKRRYPILITAALLLVVAVVGATRIVPNTAVIDYFNVNSPLRRDYAVVEEAFGGSSQVVVLVKGDMSDPAALQAMFEFQQEVAKIDGVGPTSSIATVLRAIHHTLTGVDGLPTTREEVAQELLLYQLSGDPEQVSKYLTLDSQMALVDIATKSEPTAILRRMVDDIEAAGEATLGNYAELGYTGSTPLQLAIEDSLLHDFIISLSLAIVLVIIIDSFVRSVRAAVVTISALLLTIALQYGLLGFFGIPLDLSTMLLGALAIGVGDYAIHLTVRYMEERRAGLAPEAAMSQALHSSGRSILFTALTLGAGFLALVVSQFVPVRTLGSLMAFTVVSVGTASLTLLPAACLVFLRNPRGSTTAATAPAKA
ncbi:MAG: MMPL family transporter [Truepera sp.]|jgi:predicted RND superfamily exporter protein|nr:MMPL family transporter [Truepera sp.]